MRYILSKFTQYIEQRAWNNAAHNNLEHFYASTVDIEHILPQTPNDNVMDSFDKPEKYEEYVEKLGNLTLLEKTINTSVSNDLYVNKKAGYRQSSFLLTRSIAEKPQVGSNTQLNRAVRDLLQFEEWSSESIELRQEMLVKLASEVWGMPSAEDNS
ncbi:hypothetical protein SDC9_171123 [bioreactor metagenome]|uniref:GmrSD restriction endonucleases C-terminal domain-containing protein n=1 Tax=bioreactor metagenome TaxID=1076179 RepID=A0A645GCD0_9ZZZZ